MTRAGMASDRSFPTTLITWLQGLALVGVLVSGPYVGIGGGNVNSERLLLPLILGGLFVAVALSGRFAFNRVAGFYLGWAVTVVAAALVSGAFKAHLNGLLISIAPFVYFLLFVQRGLSRDGLRRVVEALLWISSLASNGVFAVWITTGALGFAIDRGRIHLFMSEPNIFGSTLAALMMIHLAFFRATRRHLLLHAASLVALALTQSKAPYLAYLLALLYYLFRSGRLRGTTPAVVVIGGLVLVPLLGVIFSGSLFHFYEVALDRPDAISNRIYALQIGWRRFLEHPVLGNGPLDFALQNQSILQLMGTENARNMWIWQIWVAVLHDEGLIGFVLFAGALGSAWLWAGRWSRRGDPAFVAFQAALLVEVICSQVTTTHLSAIFGIVMGLAASLPVRLALPAPAARRVPHPLAQPA